MVEITLHKSTRKSGSTFALALLAGFAWLAGSMSVPMHVHAANANANANGTCHSASSGGKTVTTVSFASSPKVCVGRTALLTTMGYDTGNGNPNNVQVCHIPQGQPAAEHTIIVNQSAVPAHLAQGDTLGMCPNWVSQAAIAAMPSCTAISTGGGTEDGVWMPQNTLNDGALSNAYLSQVQSGALSGHLDTSTQSYREISGQ